MAKKGGGKKSLRGGISSAASRERERMPVLRVVVQKAVCAELGISVQKRRGFKRWAEAALEPDSPDMEVVIRLVEEAEGRALNHAYRGKDYATNVLSFVYDEDTVGERESIVAQGDLVLCVPVVRREAEAQGKSLEAHFAHLVVHGMLHLQGHDHEWPNEASVMEEREVEILAGLGYDNPYDA